CIVLYFRLSVVSPCGHDDCEAPHPDCCQIGQAYTSGTNSGAHSTGYYDFPCSVHDGILPQGRLAVLRWSKEVGARSVISKPRQDQMAERCCMLAPDVYAKKESVL